MFVYAGFWGLADIYLNDEKVDENRVAHVMHTEFVRKEPYDLVFDAEVNPKAQQLHLIVPPLTPKGEHSPVKTGFTLPNDREMPFLHVMFPEVELNANAVTTGAAGAPAGEAEAEATEAPAATGEVGVGGTPPVIEVTAKSYEFEPEPIELEKGETVRFVVTSPDIYHTFSVKRSKDAEEDLFSLQVFPDKPAEKVFTAEEAGTLYLYCKPHEGLGMTGAIEVES